MYCFTPENKKNNGNFPIVGDEREQRTKFSLKRNNIIVLYLRLKLNNAYKVISIVAKYISQESVKFQNCSCQIYTLLIISKF